MSPTPALLRNPASGKVHRGLAENRRVDCARRENARPPDILALIQPGPVEWAVGWQLLAAGVRPRELCTSCFGGDFVNEYATKWNELGHGR